MKAKRNKSGDVIYLRGSLEYALRDAASGEVVQQGANHNVVVTAGRSWILSRLYTNDSNTIDRVYLGTGTTAPATSQTALANSFSSRSVGTFDNAGIGSATPFMRFNVSWASNETHASSSVINEFGLFAANATMVGRLTTSSTINFSSTNTLAITYTLSN